MPNFLKHFDGTGRKPRDVQVEVLKWLDANWDARVLCLNMPVGSGKSAISKAIADTVGAHVITPSNILVNQYAKTYPKHNFLKGRAHYPCQSIPSFSCQEWVDISCEKPCTGCRYVESKARALIEPTFFNPMSMFYLTKHQDWTSPGTLVIDEAHTLSGMILQMCGTRLPQSEYKFQPQHVHEVEIVPWLEQQSKKLYELAKVYKNDPKRLVQISNESSQLRTVLSGLRENAQNYAIWIEKGRFKGRPDTFLNIRPIVPPQFMVKAIIQAKRIVLMSGTLFDSDIKDLVGDMPYSMLDVKSPIPIANRLLRYEPIQFPMNKDTDSIRIVHEIEAAIARRPAVNTIIHVTYALSKKLAPQFRIPIIYNDRDNKDEKLELFKRRGGVFLAAGCAEGVDLPGELCRLNIVPKLPFPDLSDPVVQKRKAAEGGDLWYKLQTFKTLIQMVGRSTRGEDDFSTSIIMDPNFPRMFSACKEYLPKSFKEAVVWSAS